MRRGAIVGWGLLLAACAMPVDEGSVGGDLTDIPWQLESGTVDGTALPILASHPITLSFTEEAAVGTAACNGYGAAYSITGEEITLSELGSTAMACEPEEVMESERLYMEALPRVDTITAGRDGLTLLGDGVELGFVALPPAPVEELTGTVWVLEGLIEGDVTSSVAGERATLELFSDGSMLGSTGCRDLNGRYVIRGAEVLLPELAANGECPAELQEQDGLVVTVLGDGFQAVVEGGTLTVSSRGGLGLVYRAEG